MDQNIDNRQKEILWDLLANPAENGQVHAHNLEQLVQDNPQSGLLQVMYARSLQTPDIRKAAAYFSPKALHKLMHNPDGLLPVSRDRVNQTFNGNQTTEPENYFNIGTATEAAELISHAPVAETEALITQDVAQPADNFASTEASTPEQDGQQLPAAQEEEKTFALPAEDLTAEPEVQDEQTYDTPPPLPQSEQTDHHQAVQTESASPTSDDDDEDAFANPWDLSKLDDVEEIAVAEPEAEQAQEPVIETLAQPETEPEKAPEPETEKAPEAQPEQAAEPVAAVAQQEPQIETYDHSLSAFEQHAVNQADTPGSNEPAEVSSFESYYRPENVFHKQDEIEDEVYDEIVSIDEIGVESLGNKFAEDPEEASVEAAEPDEEATAAQQTYIDDETEKLIYGNIAATDYLSFDKKLDELRAGTTGAAPQPEPVAEAPVAQAQPVSAAQTLPQISEAAKEPHIISKYNDDTLPYSFMWWLDKTRKEHAGVNQPYAEPEQAAQTNDAKKDAPDELQQQYYANIFSLTSVSSIGEIQSPQIEFDHTKKEDIIIERFIHTDPQIKPLSADKLDNENKAKKSSEDQDAMVTETLARIYGDQMLYHKAIATYKNLMLKIPEKKLYFAAQIEQLEKKIN
ncbi:hypothetical protein [Mucilaginibacter sp.]|uniref:hypothetical protein n=1 Tax=Mucilaginibacter sp. TaxID=1882438 RepID=UPI00326368E5